jgi:hypothetical protein
MLRNLAKTGDPVIKPCKIDHSKNFENEYKIISNIMLNFFIKRIKQSGGEGVKQQQLLVEKI